ncbi:hypothetical protein AWC38_SpisGene6728 [Stylophora pistillata]|uniref:Integrase catalytic domain-containing protein n=1 Tax=Stylophora pistillata TaxID=50429 RepID=A0A2B4SHG9_STYPI|nr:hypothetical protein AWC38_SpisGene6728 [Stylophora pistillata]
MYHGSIDENAPLASVLLPPKRSSENLPQPNPPINEELVENLPSVFPPPDDFNETDQPSQPEQHEQPSQPKEPEQPSQLEQPSHDVFEQSSQPSSVSSDSPTLDSPLITSQRLIASIKSVIKPPSRRTPAELSDESSLACSRKPTTPTLVSGKSRSSIPVPTAPCTPSLVTPDNPEGDMETTHELKRKSSELSIPSPERKKGRNRKLPAKETQLILIDYYLRERPTGPHNCVHLVTEACGNRVFQSFDAWLQSVAFKLQEELDLSISLHPEDSISNISSVNSKSAVGSRRRKSKSNASSSISRSSTASSARLRASAKKAALSVEASALRTRQDIQLQELLLKQKKENFELETELAKTEAEEKKGTTVVVADCQENLTLTPVAQFSTSTPCQDRDRETVEVAIDQTEKDCSPLNPDACEWKGYTHSPYTSCGESAESKLLEQHLDLSHKNVSHTIEVQKLQQQQNQQLQELLKQQQLQTLVMSLPQPEISVFSGNPVKYSDFVRAFENLIESKTNSPSSRLYYLVQYTSGEAKELMRSCLSMDPIEGYKTARALLEDRYGESYKIATALIDQLTKSPQIKADDGPALQRYSVLLTSCKNSLQEIGYLSKIENPDTLQKIIGRLPLRLRQRWRKKADQITEDLKREVTIGDIVEFVEAKARIANHPVFGNIHSNEDKNTAAGAGHMAMSCPKQSYCQTVGCKIGHRKNSTFLHPKNDKPAKTEPASPSETQSSNTDNEKQNDRARSCFTEVVACKGTCSATGAGATATGLAIVPVNVRAKGKENMVQTYAFLDPGSNTTFCTDKLIERLGTTGRKATLSLTTMDSDNVKSESLVVNLEVSDLQGRNVVELSDVFSRVKLPVTLDDIAVQSDVERWLYLTDIDLPCIDADVELLIGSDVPKALEPQEVQRSEDGRPYAVRTLLGWTINGPLGRPSKSSRTTNRIQCHVLLDQQFARFCEMEFNDSQFSIEKGLSQDDKRALSVMEESAEFRDGHYEIALPWKVFPPGLPNNKLVAERRLALLKKRLVKDPELYRKYSVFMDDLFNKGHARKVPEDQRDISLAWYLPHHPVTYPQKSDKVRVIFDCAAKFQNVSLNQQILQGPHLTNSLSGVLTRCKEQPIAIMADVEKMFYQVQVPTEDPLGFIAPLILPAKAILRDLCRKGLDWDDRIPHEDLVRWQDWLRELPKLEQFAVDRIKPKNFGCIVTSQIHNFSDALTEGYGAVSYLQVVNEAKNVHCAFLIGKSRQTPQKSVTIPRMELIKKLMAWILRYRSNLLRECRGRKKARAKVLISGKPSPISVEEMHSAEIEVLKKSYWIIKGRVAVRNVVNRCFSCRGRQSPSGAQKMADLPADRVTPDKPPFSFVGVNCFGPFWVKRARSQVKRYGVLFTCLATRAIHLEVAQSMDTDSFVNSLRRFIARRSIPEVMRSDNGSNFVSGNKELQEAISEWNESRIHEFFLQRNIHHQDPILAAYGSDVLELSERFSLLS